MFKILMPYNLVVKMIELEIQNIKNFVDVFINAMSPFCRNDFNTRFLETI